MGICVAWDGQCILEIRRHGHNGFFVRVAAQLRDFICAGHRRALAVVTPQAIRRSASQVGKLPL